MHAESQAQDAYFRGLLDHTAEYIELAADIDSFKRGLARHKLFRPMASIPSPSRRGACRR